MGPSAAVFIETPAVEAQRVEALIAAATAHLEGGRPADALSALCRLEFEARIGHVAATLIGLLALSAGAPETGLLWFDRALGEAPTFIEALSGRATALSELKRYGEAAATFARAIGAGCADPVVHFNHGNALVGLGRRDEAIAAFDQALRLRPDYPEALRAGGAILAETGHYDEALRFWDEGLRLRPDDIDLILDKANLLERRDRRDEAVAALDDGLRHHLDEPRLLNNRGVVLFGLGRMDEAIDSLDRALVHAPSFAPALLHKGEVRIRQGRFAEALAALDGALALAPAYVPALCARGIALKLLGHFDEARRCFDEGLRLDPTCVYTRTNKGELGLLLGDFAAGWRDYDSRFLTRGHERPVLGWPVPEWAGEANPGRVVVFADQAVGDIIHFARYLPVLRAAGADVTLVCRPRMQRLLKQASRGMRVVAEPPRQGPFDFQVPLSNMPHACSTDEPTMPRAPYLAAEPALVDLWRERIGTHGFKIGLCWRGSQDWRSDPKRSVPLDRLRPLAEIPGVRLVSLQMADNLGSDHATFAAMGIEPVGNDLDAGVDGFVETAAVMACLDLIVSCDTSILHLAGALGRPTFALLQKVPEWRFMVEREDSPWYPSMRLFRQVEIDAWDHPVARLAGAARELAESSVGVPD